MSDLRDLIKIIEGDLPMKKYTFMVIHDDKCYPTYVSTNIDPRRADERVIEALGSKYKGSQIATIIEGHPTVIECSGFTLKVEKLTDDE